MTKIKAAPGTTVRQIQETFEQKSLSNTNNTTPRVQRQLPLLDAIDHLIVQAEFQIEKALDDETWTRHFLIWRELYQLKYGSE